MTIKEYCSEILVLLKSVDENEWSKVFDYFLEQCDLADEKYLQKDIRKIYAGMGSFNDLVLHKNGTPLIQENEKLNDLREGLYQELIKARLSDSAY